MGDLEIKRGLYDKLGFKATAGQLPLLEDDTRITLIAGGERAGKSRISTMKALPKLFTGDLFWLVGKEYSQCRAEWNYLVEDLSRLGILKSATKNIDPGVIVYLENKRIVTLPTSQPEKIATEAPDGIIACEAAQIDYEAYLRLKGRLGEKRAWMIMSGTYESSLGWYPEHFIRWQAPNNEEAKSFSLPSWSNTVIYPGGRQDKEILSFERECTTERFSERYGGVPCPPSGKAVPEFSNGIHVGDYDFDPELPVSLWIDPGYAGAYAVEVVQRWAEQVVIVDEVYLQGYVTSEIIDICKDPFRHPWWKNVTSGVIDIAGRQHQAMEAPVEIWLAEGHLSLRSQKVKEEYGLEVLRSFMKVNPVNNTTRLLVNSKCKGFISECGGCKSPVNGGMWMRDKHTGKLIDRDNHACFDDRTEILTENGWKLFADLEREKVATLGKGGYIKYQKPTVYYEHYHEGKMIRGKGKEVDFLCTPDHRMYIASPYRLIGQRYEGSNELPLTFSFREAKDLSANNWIKRTGKWKGTDIDFEIHHNKAGDVHISMVDLARYYGLWLAEGSKGKSTHKNKYVVHVDQKVKKKEVEEIVAKLGLPYTKHTDLNDVTRYSISCKEFYSFFADQGNCSEKEVPKLFLNASCEAISALLYGYLLGDGTFNKKGYSVGYSTSKKLLDGMQEIAFKLGIPSNLNDYRYLKKKDHHKGIYQLSLHKEGKLLKENGLTSLNSRNISEEDYSGNVYCVSVPNETIAVRRNGKIMWAGNCKAVIYGLVDAFGYTERTDSLPSTKIRASMPKRTFVRT